MARVLVVDDDERIRRLVSDLLTANAHKVVQAQDGVDAVAKAKAELPDVILMDVFMPKMDGYAALQAIKNEESTKTIPVVMVTAIGHDLNRKLAEGLGSCGYITKPFSAKEVLDAVARLVQVHSGSES